MSENWDETTKTKAELIKNLLAKISLPNDALSEISGLDEETIDQIREQRFRDEAKEKDVPLSWDYAMVFRLGDEKDKRVPTKKEKKKHEGKEDAGDEWSEGMAFSKYAGQVVLDYEKRLNKARLKTKKFRSSDNSLMFLLIGITEKNLKYWADCRDTDVLIDPKGAIEVGKEKRFPLALRTDKGEIADSNWENLYVEYHPAADPRIYTQYNRKKNDESYKTPFDEKTRLRIIYECIITDTNDGGAEIAIDEIIKNKKHPMDACFALHDTEKCENFNQNWIKNCSPTAWMWCPLDQIRDYFGEPVGFYFAFLTFYMKWLLIPMVVGIIFFIIQSALGEFDVPAIQAMGLLIIFWSVAFVDFWKREEARLRLRWGMTKYQEKAVSRPQFKGEWLPDDITGMYTEQFDFLKKLFRVSIVSFILITFLCGCVVAVVVVLLQKDKDPNDTFLKIALGVANGVMISIFNIIYKVTSFIGNNVENHRTQQEYENALIMKGFFFKFFNSFASLFYLGFVRPAVKGESYYVHYYNTVCADAASGMQAYVADYNGIGVAGNEPIPKDKDGNVVTSCLAEPPTNADSCINKVFDDSTWSVVYQGYTLSTGGTKPAWSGCEEDIVTGEVNEAVLNELFFQLVSLFGTALVIQNAFEVGIPALIGKCKDNARAKKAREAGKPLEEQSEVEKQAELGVYENTIEDMTELIIQFGYVTLFVMAFPLTPFLAVLNNIIEMKVDAINVVLQCQRPHPNGSYGLGSWNSVLEFFSIISVATNVAMITFRTGVVSVFLKGNVAGSWIFFSVLSVILGLIVSAEKAIIPDVPAVCEAAQERQRLVENVLVKNAKVEEFEEERPGGDDDDDEDAGNLLEFNPGLDFQTVDKLDEIPKGDIQYTQFETTP